MLPDPLARLVRQLARLPGIGERTAARLAFHLLQSPPELMEEFAQALVDARQRIRACEQCGQLSEEPLCAICASPRREPTTLCVVESPTELVALERSGAFSGRYHVLGGLIAPLSGVGPGDLRIEELVQRAGAPELTEVILALPASVDGDATALYLNQRLAGQGVRCSRLAQGLPMGSELQHLDEGTLARALQGRQDMGPAR